MSQLEPISLSSLKESTLSSENKASIFQAVRRQESPWLALFTQTLISTCWMTHRVLWTRLWLTRSSTSAFRDTLERKKGSLSFTSCISLLVTEGAVVGLTGLSQVLRPYEGLIRKTRWTLKTSSRATKQQERSKGHN